MSELSGVSMGYAAKNLPPTDEQMPRRSADTLTTGNAVEQPAQVPGHERPREVPTPVTVTAAQAAEALAMAAAIGSLFPQPLDVFERVRIGQSGDSYEAYTAQRRALLNR